MAESFVIISKDQILQRICGEYLEMPGLRLTHGQAQRLWGLDAETSDQLLESLIEDHFLCRGRDGTYARLADSPMAFPAPRMVKGLPTSVPAEVSLEHGG